MFTINYIGNQYKILILIVSAAILPLIYSSYPRAATPGISEQTAADRLAIQDVLVRYCYAVDDRNWDAYRQVFTRDAIIDDTKAGGIRGGVEEHVTFMKRALSKILISQHAISTTMLEIKGDEAFARTHCSCPMVVDLGGGKTQVFQQGLWYRDKLVRTPQGWRLKERVEEAYCSDNVPAGFKF